MKTLDQINEDICLAVESRIKHLRENGLGGMIDSSLEDTLRNAYMAVEVNNRFMQLHDIAVELDAYLNLKDKSKEEVSKSFLKVMISKL